MNNPRRLGRGLEALLGQIPFRQGGNPPAQNTSEETNPSAGADQVTHSAGLPHQNPSTDFFGASGGVNPSEGGQSQSPLNTGIEPPSEMVAPSPPISLKISEIESNPYQPRQDFEFKDHIELVESIRAHGLLQPVLVRRHGEKYQLVAGERRLRAAGEAGCTEVPVHVIEADDRQTAEMAIIENMQRKDLNPLEKAAAFQRYLQQYACTQEDLAGRLNLDRSTIANLIRLLELPQAVQESIRRKEITQGHARALLPLGEEREQIEFCRRIQREGLNVRQTEALVQQTIEAADAEPLAVIDRDGNSTPVKRRATQEHVAALEQQFRTILGVKNVTITHNAKGKGKIVIQFRNHDEFDQIRRQICDTPGGGVRSQTG
ncbi:MAG: ParB/RepB/Spo0J family partition protein [Pirellulales bacterium]|nr:ParB/RepB/Spo0J family partition protein [Pirellulales bacterium]